MQALAGLGSRGHVFIIVARVQAHFAVIQVCHMGADTVQEVAIVGNDDHGALTLVEHFFQPANGIDVQVVGGLVQQHDVRIGEQGLGQQHAQFPAGGNLTHGTEVLLHRNIQAQQQLTGAGFGGVAVQLGEFRLQLTGADAVFLAHFRLGVDAVALFLDLPQLFVAHDHGVYYRVFLVGELILAQLADALVRVLGHIAGGRLQVPPENLHKGGFAAAVGADQAVAVAVAEFHGHVFKQRLGTELHGEVGGCEQCFDPVGKAKSAADERYQRRECARGARIVAQRLASGQGWKRV